MTLWCPRALNPLLSSEVSIGRNWRGKVPERTGPMAAICHPQPPRGESLPSVSEARNSREWLGRLNAFNRPSKRPWETTLTTTAALFYRKPLHGAFHTRLYRILHVKCHNLTPRATSVGTPKKSCGNDWNGNIL